MHQEQENKEMVRVQKIEYLKEDTHEAKVSIFADTKAEVDTAEIEGMPDGYNIEMGSTLMTASGELAFMKSDSSWNWV